MSDLTELQARNARFAADYKSGTPIMPTMNTILLTCVDARTDPTDFLGLTAGEALVFRNAGGRVTESVALDVSVLWNMVKRMAGENFRGLSLAIIRHTDCGMERLANPQMAQMLSQKLGVAHETIDEMAIHDHRTSIEQDIARLRASAIVPDELVVSGHVLDLQTGVMTEIVPEAPLG